MKRTILALAALGVASAAATTAPTHAQKLTALSCADVRAEAEVVTNLLIAQGKVPPGWTKERLIQDDFDAFREGGYSHLDWTPCDQPAPPATRTAAPKRQYPLDSRSAIAMAQSNPSTVIVLHGALYTAKQRCNFPFYSQAFIDTVQFATATLNPSKTELHDLYMEGTVLFQSNAATDGLPATCKKVADMFHVFTGYK